MSGLGDLHGRTIAVVDDEADLRDILEEELRARGALVLAFESGDKVLSFITQANPPILLDAIVSDHRMRGQTGIEVLHQLSKFFRERGVAKPLFALITGYSEIPVEDHARAGIDISLTKPFDLMSVVDLLVQRLDQTAQGVMTKSAKSCA